jgi:arginyl-tRNA--protein-N-Asp/Glu arginylyltransferase
MLKLSERLPKKGSLSYNSDNMAPLRPEIDKITNTLIKSNKSFYTAFNRFCTEAMKRDEKTRQMLIAQNIDKKLWPQYLTADKAVQDVYRRIGNYVINSVLYHKRREETAKSKYAQKHIRKKTTRSILAQCARMAAAAEQEAMEAFREYMEKLEEGKNMEDENYIEHE